MLLWHTKKLETYLIDKKEHGSPHLEGILVIIPGAGTLGHAASMHRTIFFKLALFIISHLCFNRPTVKMRPIDSQVSAGPVSWVNWEGESFVAPQSSLCSLITRVPGLQAGYWHAASLPSLAPVTTHVTHNIGLSLRLIKAKYKKISVLIT